MAQIKNTGTLKEIQEAGNLQTGFDQIPTEASKAVVYTMEVNPKIFRRINLTKYGSSTTTGTSTMFTCSSLEDTYITNMNFSVSKNAACDGTLVYFTITPEEGKVHIPFYIAMQTLTAESHQESIQFNPPLKLKRGTNITIEGDFTAGAMNKRCSVHGYTVSRQGV